MTPDIKNNIRHCLTLDHFSSEEILHIVHLALKLKRDPDRFSGLLQGRWLLMLF